VVRWFRLGNRKPRHLLDPDERFGSEVIAAQTAVIIFALLALACGAALATVLFRQQHQTGIYDGIENFRRHIDALSPEARRSVVQRHVQSKNSDIHDPRL